MPPSPLQEGRDFYVENGLYVFTELYLRERGHCCRSGCRHCPYGFRKDEPRQAASSGPISPAEET